MSLSLNNDLKRRENICYSRELLETAFTAVCLQEVVAYCMSSVRLLSL